MTHIYLSYPSLNLTPCDRVQIDQRLTLIETAVSSAQIAQYNSGLDNASNNSQREEEFIHHSLFIYDNILWKVN